MTRQRRTQKKQLLNHPSLFQTLPLLRSSGGGGLLGSGLLRCCLLRCCCLLSGGLSSSCLCHTARLGLGQSLGLVNDSRSGLLLGGSGLLLGGSLLLSRRLLLFGGGSLLLSCRLLLLGGSSLLLRGSSLLLGSGLLLLGLFLRGGGLLGQLGTTRCTYVALSTV